METKNIAQSIVPQETFKPNWIVTVNDIAVTNYLTSGVATLGCTEQVDTSTITLNNTNGRYTNLFNKGNIIKIYADYKSGTNQIYEGRMYTPIYILTQRTHELELFSRGYGADALGKKVNLQYDEADTIPNIFIYLRDTYLPNHSSDNIYIDQTITTEYLPSWNYKSLHECFRDLIGELQYDYSFRCDYNKKWHLFQQGSRICTKHSCAFGSNLINGRFTDGDMLNLKNKYYGYGQEKLGIPIMASKENLISQTEYGITIEDIIEDSNITSIDTLKTKLTNLLNKNTTLEQTGTITTDGLPYLNAGEMIPILYPFGNTMGHKKVVSLTHTLSPNQNPIFSTTITYNELEQGLVTLMKNRILNEQSTSNIRNKWNMKESFVITFEPTVTEPEGDTTGLLTQHQTTMWDGYLMLSLSMSNGYVITINKEFESIYTQFVFMIDGKNLNDEEGVTWTTYKVSFNNGYTWTTCTPNLIYDIPENRRGKNVKIKIDLTSLTTKIKGVGVLAR